MFRPVKADGRYGVGVWPRHDLGFESSNEIRKGSVKALVISPDRRTTSELKTLLSQQLPSADVAELQSYPTRRSFSEMTAVSPPSLCLLDLESDRETAIALIGDMVSLLPSVQIIVTLASNNSDLIMRSLRQGAADFLVKPFASDQFRSALERVTKLSPLSGPEGAGKVICVMPAKGACGATTIACNLALYIRKQNSKRTLLADLDPLAGTVSFLLKLKSKFSFIDALQHADELDGEIWKGLIQQSNGVEVLLPPENPMTAGLSELTDPSPLIQFARRSYDQVVLDCHGGYGEWSLTMARMADELMLVTTNELPALQATMRVLSYLEANRVPRAKVKLVVNRFNRDVGLTKDMIETALRTEVYQLISSDYEAVQKALLEGKGVSPSGSFGKSLLSLAERLAGQAAPKKANTGSSFSGLFSMFSRS